MEKENLTRMFVFGTLINPNVRAAVGVPDRYIEPAVLRDYRKKSLNILESKGDLVVGLTFFVNDEELERLDDYEGVPAGHYRRFEVTIQTPEEETTAQVYQLT